MVLTRILRIRFFLVFFLTLSTGASSLFAAFNESEYLLLMLSDAYESGDYKVGLSRSRDLFYAIEKEEGRSVTVGHVHAWKALLYFSLSEFDNYATELKTADAILHGKSKKTTECQQAFLTLAKAHAINGNYKDAVEILKDNRPNVDSTSLLNYEYEYSDILYLSKMGFLVESEKRADACYKDIKAKSDTSARISILRQNVFLTHFDILYELGDYLRCFQLIKNNQLWFENHFKFKHGAIAELHLRHARLLAHKNDVKQANVYYRKAFNSGIRYYHLSAPFFTVLQHERIENLKANGQHAEADYWLNDLDVRILSYYGRQSLSFLNHKLYEVEYEYKNGNWKSAQSAFMPLLSRSENLPAHNIGLIRINEIKYKIEQELANAVQAEKTLEKLLVLVKEKYGEPSPYYHAYLLDRYIFQYTYTNQISGIDSSFKSSLFQVIKPHLTVFNELYIPRAFALVTLYNLNEEYDKAEENIALFKEEAKEKSKLLEAEALALYGETERLRGNYVTSQDYFVKSIWLLKSAERKDEKIVSTLVYRKEAELFKETGDYPKAETAYSNADKVFGDQLINNYKTSVKDNAWLKIYRGNYQKTAKELKEEWHNNELKVGDTHYSNIKFLLYLSEIDMQLGEFITSEEYILKAQEITQEVFGPQSEQNAKVLQMQKKLYESIGDFQKSEAYAFQSLTILQGKFGENHVKTAIPKSEYVLSVGLNHKELQDTVRRDGAKLLKQKCDGLLQEAASVVQSEFGTDNPLYATVKENSGKFKLLTLELDAARNDISTTRAIWNKLLGEPNFHSAQMDYILGEIAYYNKEYTVALQHFLKSKSAYEDIFGSDHPDYVASLAMASRMYYILGNTKESVETSQEVVEKSLQYIHTIFPILSERGKTNYWMKVKEHFEFFNTLAFRFNKEYPNLIGEAFNINLQTKSILLNSSLKTKNLIIQSGDSVLVATYDLWMDKKQAYISALSMGANERKKEDIELNLLQEELESLEKYLGRQSIGFDSVKTKSSDLEWEDLASILNKDDQVVEIVAFRYFDKEFTDSIWYAVMEVDNNTRGNPKFELINNGNFLHEEGIAYYRNCLGFNVPDNKSYETFWQPIEQLITKNGRVFISFDGVYNCLNLETILLPEGSLVVDDYKISIIGTSRDLLKNRIANTKSVGKRGFFLGNPSFYSASYTGRKTWGQLPGTEKEVQQLSASLRKKRWSLELYEQETATESVVKKTKSPRVFHVATHGYYIKEEAQNNIQNLVTKSSTNPLLRSGLLLKNGGEIYEGSKAYEFNRADGILTAYEVMNLDLNNTDLVVLSACETGLGDIELGEGVFGLQRAFAVAGAKSTIMSLFKVSDEVTTELMANFYNYWSKNLSKTEAFLAAKKDIMEKYDNNMYWGAFVIVGTE